MLDKQEIRRMQEEALSEERAGNHEAAASLRAQIARAQRAVPPPRGGEPSAARDVLRSQSTRSLARIGALGVVLGGLGVLGVLYGMPWFWPQPVCIDEECFRQVQRQLAQTRASYWLAAQPSMLSTAAAVACGVIALLGSLGRWPLASPHVLLYAGLGTAGLLVVQAVLFWQAELQLSRPDYPCRGSTAASCISLNAYAVPLLLAIVGSLLVLLAGAVLLRKTAAVGDAAGESQA